MKTSDPAKRQRSSLFSWYDGFERVEASRASKFGTQSVSFLRDRERPPSGSGDECYDVPETALSQLPQNLLFAVNLFGIRVFSSSLCRGPTPASPLLNLSMAYFSVLGQFLARVELTTLNTPPSS